MHDSQFPQKQNGDGLWAIAFWVAAIALWTIALGNLPLRDWDEGSHALAARELYRTGNWLYLTFFGEPYFMKPPLGYWIVASSYHLLGGVSELSTRLPVALISASSVPLVYWVGRELFAQRLGAILSASVYLTLLPVVRHGRLMMLDGIVNTFFLLLLLCLLKSRQQRLWAVGMGLCAAAIALTKGVLVLAMGAIAVLYILVDRQWKILRNPYTWLGLVFGSAIVFSWYYAQWHKYGAVFVQIHLGTQNFERLSSAVEGNDGPPWYYLLELLKYSFPWLLFWPGGLVLAWQKRRQSWGALVLSGTLLFLGTISLMGTKLPWYVMPLYPLFSLAVGAKLLQLWESHLAYSRFWSGFFGFLSVASVGGGVYFVLADPQPALLAMAMVAAIAMGLTAWQLRCNNRNFIPTSIAGMYFTLTLLMLSKSWIWELNETFPVTDVGRLVRENTPAGTTVYTSFAYNRPSLDFYSDRKVDPADLETLKKLRQEGRYLLLDRTALDTLQVPEAALLGTAEGFALVQ